MLLIIAVTAGLVVLSVGIHFEVLVFLSFLIERFRSRARLFVALSVLGALFAHLIEMVLFSIAYYVLHSTHRHGGLLSDAPPDDFSDYIYYSFVVYTSLGFGDITPTGLLRMLTAMETLTGLVLIAWTASFLFLQMQIHWGEITSQTHLFANNESQSRD